MRSRVPIKYLFDVSRDMVMPTDFGSEPLFHYSLPAWHEHGDGEVENAADLASGKLLLNGGEVLVSKLNPEKSAVLVAKSHEIPTVCSPEFIALIPRKIDTRFSYYSMLSAPVRHQLNASVESVTNSHKRARVDRFLASPLEIPDLPIQRTIADFLDCETARIDLLIEKKQRLVALLGEKRSATITAAVNGKIEVEGVGNRDCLLAERGGGVRFDKLKRLVDPVRPITYGIVQAGPEFEGGIPYIRPADMTDETGVKDFASIKRTNPDIAHQYRRSSVKTGDLVVSIGPSFGKVMEVPRELDGANLTQGTARVSPGSNLEKRFAFWCLRSQHCYSQWEASIGGATFRALNLGPLAETRIPLPDLPTQRAIADFLDRETARLQQIQVTTQQSIDRLKEYRSALITAAVTGQIDVAKWSKTGTDERQLNAIQTEMKH